MTDKSKAAAEREMRVLERSELVVRDADGKSSGLTPAGLELVEKLAAKASTQNSIAGKLKITASAFRKLLGKADEETPARFAWEKGRGEHEQDIIKKLLMHGAKNPIALIYYSKAKLGWRENEAPSEASTSNIKIILPAPMSREDYYRMLGITGPVDAANVAANKMKTIEHRAGAIPASEDSPLYQSKLQQKET